MDQEYIKKLVELMVDSDLTRVEIREGDTHLLLKRGHAPAISHAMMPQPMPVPPQLAPPAHAPAAVHGPVEPVGDDSYITSPMVGTFYAQPDPESPPFVSVGTMVGPETVVCLIEAMKVFNEIKAGVGGRITRVMVKNGEAVEFERKLFSIAPA
jgi:acetyl-CoA carboxylase biotin carboxyl carrier protein